ncbi:MAG: glycosyltransferase family 39 protein [Alphaproteobacteria bacterium]|nr:glycosyltransferase family 39 protein [Alphaproteobacteria bacterium]
MDDGTARWRFFLGAAVAVGLACLTKYIGALLLVGFGLTVLLAPRYRRLLLDWRSYAGLAIVVAMQAPVLIWNIETDFASFRLHLVDRQQLGFGLTWTHLLSFALQLLVLVGPFLIWPTIRVFLGRQGGFEGRSAELGKTTFGASTLGFSLVALGNFVSGHWNIVGQATLLPALVRQVGRGWQLVAHSIYGAAMGMLLLINYTAYPVLGVDTLETYRGYGWSEIAAAYREETGRLQPYFLAASHYQLASQLNFALRTTQVTALSQRLDQYDYWFDDAAHLGQTALILDDGHSPLEAAVITGFDAVEEIRRVQIVRQGVVINTYRIYLATGYRGAGDLAQRYQF